MMTIRSRIHFKVKTKAKNVSGKAMVKKMDVSRCLEVKDVSWMTPTLSNSNVETREYK